METRMVMLEAMVRKLKGLSKPEEISTDTFTLSVKNGDRFDLRCDICGGEFLTTFKVLVTRTNEMGVTSSKEAYLKYSNSEIFMTSSHKISEMSAIKIADRLLEASFDKLVF